MGAPTKTGAASPAAANQQSGRRMFTLATFFTTGWTAVVPARSLASRVELHRVGPPCMVLDESTGMPEGELPESLFGDDDGDDDLGLLRMPRLQTPAQAAFQRYRERMRPQSRLGVNGEDDPIARCALGDVDPAAGTRGGNDLGFSLREAIFDDGDDMFGI